MNQSTQANTRRTSANLLAMAAIALVIGLAALFVACGSAQAAEDAASGKDPAQVAQLVKGKNCTGKANTKTVLRFGWFNGKQLTKTKKTVKAYDVTGDGKADSLKVVIGGSTGYSTKYMKLYVNGKRLKTITDNAEGSRAIVQVVTLKNKQPFIYVCYTGNNSDGTYALYQYRSGKLKALFSSNNIPAAYGGHRHIESLKPVDNAVRVDYRVMTLTAGSLNMLYTYKYDKSKKTLAISKNGGRVMARDYSNGGKITKVLTASERMSVYADKSQGKVAFTVYADDKVTFKKSCLYKGKLMFKVKVGGKAGWLPAFTVTGPSSGTHFKEGVLAG